MTNLPPTSPATGLIVPAKRIIRYIPAAPKIDRQALKYAYEMAEKYGRRGSQEFLTHPGAGGSSGVGIGLLLLGGFVGFFGWAVYREGQQRQASEFAYAEYQALPPQGVKERLGFLLSKASSRNSNIAEWSVKEMVKLPVPPHFKVDLVLNRLQNGRETVRQAGLGSARFMVADERVHPHVRKLLRELLLEFPAVTSVDQHGNVHRNSFGVSYKAVEARLRQAVISLPPYPQALPHHHAPTAVRSPRVQVMMLNPRFYVAPSSAFLTPGPPPKLSS